MIPIAAKIGDVDMVRLRDRVLTAPVYGGIPGDFPWDRWEHAARAAGVSDDLANLGRAVFREAFQHQWDETLQVECGWLDGGQRMIYQAMGLPDATAARWTYLMEADGSPNDAAVPPVEIEPIELALALKAAGIPISLLL